MVPGKDERLKYFQYNCVQMLFLKMFNYRIFYVQRFQSRRDPDDDFKVLKMEVLPGAELLCTKFEKRDSTFDCDPSISPCLYNIVNGKKYSISICCRITLP